MLVLLSLCISFTVVLAGCVQRMFGEWCNCGFNRAICVYCKFAGLKSSTFSRSDKSYFRNFVRNGHKVSHYPTTVTKLNQYYD